MKLRFFTSLITERSYRHKNMKLAHQQCRRFLKIRSMSSKPQVSPIEYCANQLRTHDYQAYLCSLFVPSQDRHRIWALGALNVELAQVRDVVSDTQIGKIRLAWWRDTIEQTWNGSPPAHPVAQALALAKDGRQLSKSWLLRLVSERVVDCTYYLRSYVYSHATNTGKESCRVAVRESR